jgi:hypothetical protein
VWFDSTAAILLRLSLNVNSQFGFFLPFPHFKRAWANFSYGNKGETALGNSDAAEKSNGPPLKTTQQHTTQSVIQKQLALFLQNLDTHEHSAQDRSYISIGSIGGQCSLKMCAKREWSCGWKAEVSLRFSASGGPFPMRSPIQHVSIPHGQARLLPSVDRGIKKDIDHESEPSIGNVSGARIETISLARNPSGLFRRAVFTHDFLYDSIVATQEHRQGVQILGRGTSQPSDGGF